MPLFIFKVHERTILFPTNSTIWRRISIRNDRSLYFLRVYHDSGRTSIPYSRSTAFSWYSRPGTFRHTMLREKMGLNSQILEPPYPPPLPKAPEKKNLRTEKEISFITGWSSEETDAARKIAFPQRILWTAVWKFAFTFSTYSRGLEMENAWWYFQYLISYLKGIAKDIFIRGWVI